MSYDVISNVLVYVYVLDSEISFEGEGYCVHVANMLNLSSNVGRIWEWPRTGLNTCMCEYCFLKSVTAPCS